MGTANHRAYSFDMKPTIEQVEKDGKLIWQVSAAGIVRVHHQRWQAEWLYNYLTRLYKGDETKSE